MSAEHAVPDVLRGAMFAPRQAPGQREPARVSAGAFTAAGLPVPAHPAQRNIYQLTGRRGLAWTPSLDAHIRRRGAELLGHGELILADIDTPAAVDGTPMIDALRWLSDQAVEAGGLLDLSASVSVRTPGHPSSGHLPGWHLWYRADPACPVRMGPLAGCRAVELVFALWWSYFKHSAAEEIRQSLPWTFVWALAHYLIFAAVAALGAGLQVVIGTLTHSTRVTPSIAAFTVAIPVTIYVVVLALLSTRRGGEPAALQLTLLTAALTLAAAAATPILTPPCIGHHRCR